MRKMKDVKLNNKKTIKQKYSKENFPRMTIKLYNYLRANPSNSAFLSSDSGGEPMFEFFNFSGLPLNKTNLPR